ncbi:MAG: serine/threonine protein kinase, partial [Planctomycetales bacterium]|nr:serine/threonine protein kinase [Planctomycetales bacterium]
MDVVTGRICYEKIRPIGNGQGMNSEVFLVKDTYTGRELAAKEIPKAQLKQQFLNDYFTEAKAMSSARSHPNVVLIAYACDLKKKVCITMPYYKNGSLHDRIEGGPLPVALVIKIVQDLLNGLSKIHQAGYVHFDIKPSNLLFSDNDTPMVADFGQARAIARSGIVDLPPLYPDGVPPEYYLNNAIGSNATDIYHVGLLLYRALNGDPFYKRQVPSSDDEFERMTVAGKFPDRNDYLPHIPRSLRTIIRKALSIAIAHDFRTAA